MAKKNFGKCQMSNKMATQMNVTTDNVTSQCFYVKADNSYIYSYLFNMQKKYKVFL